jgi:hypothetical protein
VPPLTLHLCGVGYGALCHVRLHVTQPNMMVWFFFGGGDFERNSCWWWSATEVVATMRRRKLGHSVVSPRLSAPLTQWQASTGEGHHRVE